MLTGIEKKNIKRKRRKRTDTQKKNRLDKQAAQIREGRRTARQENAGERGGDNPGALLACGIAFSSGKNRASECKSLKRLKKLAGRRKCRSHYYISSNNEEIYLIVAQPRGQSIMFFFRKGERNDIHRILTKGNRKVAGEG